jgi:type IV secretory pathway TraG/TraD family ATPase VirD4
MWHLLGQMTRTYNPKKQLLLFNPLDQARSLSWNIVGKITNDAEAKLVATTIIAASDNPQAKSDTPFFRNSALQLLNSIMVGLVSDPNDKLSMPRVHQVLNSGKAALCEWLSANEEAARSSRTFIELAQSGSQNADTVLSELSMRLSAWDISAVRATTFFDELDLDSIVDQPSLLVVEMRESELEMLRPMANTIVVEILRFLTRRAEGEPLHRLPRPIGLVIDEFASSLGRLPDIHVKLNTLRSRNVSIVGAIQSLGQIYSAYDKEADNVIAGFGTKIFIPPLEQMDSEWASKESGTMTIRFNTTSRNRSRKVLDTFYHRDRGKQENVQQRAVLTPDEIGRSASKAATFFLPNLSAFQGHLVPYYEIQTMRERVGLKQDELRIRRSPLSEPPKALPPPLPPSAESGKSEEGAEEAGSESVANLLGEIKPFIGWDEATDAEREWWEELEADNAEHLSGLILTAVELVRRGATLSDLYHASTLSDSESVENLLEVIDNERREAEAKAANESPRYVNDAERRRAAWRRLKRQRKLRRQAKSGRTEGEVF